MTKSLLRAIRLTGRALIAGSLLIAATPLLPSHSASAEETRVLAPGISVHRAPFDDVPAPRGGRGPGQRVLVELEEARPLEDLRSLLLTRRPVDEVERARSVAEDLGVEVILGMDALFPVVVLPDDPEVLQELERRGWTRNVSADEWIELASPTERTDPPWGVDRLDQYALPLDGVHRQGSSGSGALVYVVDTGLSPRAGEFDTAELWWGGPNSWSIAESNLEGFDCEGHGTHVAGTVASNSYGVAPGARLISVKANLACESGFSTSTLLWWLNWIAEDRDDRGSGTPAVVNLSLGGGRSSAKDRAITDLVARGITVVAAAGNERSDACNTWPAGVGAAITVGASDADDRMASFSNIGRCVDVFAPGADVLSTTVDTALCSSPGYSDVSCLRSTVEAFSGTSMAAPHVAGLAARFLAANPRARPAEVEDAIVGGATARVIGAPNGTTTRLAHSLFLEGPDPRIVRVPPLGDLRVGESLDPLSLQGGPSAQVRLTSGALPSGITLQLDGRFTGTVSGHGSGSGTFTIADGFGRTDSTSVAWSTVGTPDVSALSEVTVTPADRALVVAWDGFELNSVRRGTPITRIEVRATPTTGGRARLCNARPARGTLPAGCTITRLANGTTHTVEIRAQNRAGWSAWTDATSVDGTIGAAALTPAPGAPDAVRNVRVKVTAGALRVTWAAPRADGGATPTYDVALSDDDGANWTDVTTGTSQRSTTITEGLDWGVAHRVRVRAGNSAGDSPWMTTGSVTPHTRPDVSALSEVTVTPADRALVVAWDGFELNSVRRGTPITRIEVRATPTTGGRARLCNARPARGTLPAGCTITRLANGTTHTVEIRAQNRAGWSAWTDADPAQPSRLRAPSVPAEVRASPGVAELTVTWEPPAEDGGATIVAYVAEVVLVDRPDEIVASCETSETMCTFIGLADEAEFQVRVTAINAVGHGPAAHAASPVSTLPAIEVDHEVVRPGQDVTIRAGGFLAGSDAVARVVDDAGTTSSQVVDEDGWSIWVLTIPNGTTTESVELEILGSSRTGEERTLRRSMRVDSAPPALDSFELSAPAVDVTDADASLTVIVRATDDLSGIESIDLWLEDHEGRPVVDTALSLRRQAPDSELWAVTVTIAHASPPGTYRLGPLRLRDGVGNEAHHNGVALGALAEITITVTSGHTPPGARAEDYAGSSPDTAP